MFALESLADVSDISAFSLPICAIDINNSGWYAFGATNTPTRENNEFQIVVKALTNLNSYYTITSTTTCLQLKEMIKDRDGLPIDWQYLVSELDKRWIPEATILSQRGITRGSRIHFLLPIWDFRHRER